MCDVFQENQEKLQGEMYEKKIQEFTQIILQMNKERLQLEKQLSVFKTEHREVPIS